MKVKAFLSILIFLVEYQALASDADTDTDRETPISVNPSASGESMSIVPASGNVTRSWKATTIIKIHNSCYGTNLRSVRNPLSPTSVIHSTLNLAIGSETYQIKVSYPAFLVTAQGVTGSGGSGKISPMSSEKYSISEGSKKISMSAGIYGNTVVLNTSIPSLATVNSSGVVTSDRTVELVGKSFVQEVTNCGAPLDPTVYGHTAFPVIDCGQYMGKNGPLSVSESVVVASDQSQIDIKVSFPGQNGFCGGYYSPLMLFFDSSRPRFENVSDFPLVPGFRTWWPEKGAPGYFLAWDRNQSGDIDKKDELFGDSKDAENGFESLRPLDSNKDNWIDNKDELFSKLKLWRDENGDGLSQKGELRSLSEKVERISLRYSNKKVAPLGKNAEAREFSTFTYKVGSKIKTGEIIDIWLAPAQLRLSQK